MHVVMSLWALPTGVGGCCVVQAAASSLLVVLAGLTCGDGTAARIFQAFQDARNKVQLFEGALDMLAELRQM
jgi:hypothetical protein